MTKKDYQALAGAFNATRPDIRDKAVIHSQWRADTNAIADILAADNPRFDRNTFVAACEDGNVGRRPKRKRTSAPGDMPMFHEGERDRFSTNEEDAE